MPANNAPLAGSQPARAAGSIPANSTRRKRARGCVDRQSRGAGAIGNRIRTKRARWRRAAAPGNRAGEIHGPGETAARSDRDGGSGRRPAATDAGFSAGAAIAKPGDATVKLTDVLWTVDPEVPVTVKFEVPSGVFEFVLMVRVDVPDVVSDPCTKAQVAPTGRPGTSQAHRTAKPVQHRNRNGRCSGLSRSWDRDRTSSDRKIRSAREGRPRSHQNIRVDRSQTGDQIVAGACFETDLKRSHGRAPG